MSSYWLNANASSFKLKYYYCFIRVIDYVLVFVMFLVCRFRMYSVSCMVAGSK